MGKLIILGGPSTGGKTRLQDALGLRKLVTVTTRPPREGEIDGVHYHFISVEEYDRLAAIGELPEQTVYAGVKYGVFKSTLQEVLDATEPTLAVMDSVGVAFMKDYLGAENVISIFVGADPATIRERFQDRGSAEEEVTRRVDQARAKELQPEYIAAYDLEIWNNNGTPFEQTLLSVKGILFDQLVSKAAA